MPLYDYFCEVCKKEFEELMPYSMRKDVYCCGQRAVKCISLVNTHKDLGYNFVTEMFNGKPIQVRSKGHYQSLLNKYDMVDASRKECKQHAKFRKGIVEETHKYEIKKRTDKFAETVHKEGIAKEAEQILKKMCKVRKEVKNG